MERVSFLGIAIDEYFDGKLENPSNSVHDLKEIAAVLDRKYEIDDIEILVNKAETSRKNIYCKLTEFFANCFEGDSIILYYAGHGKINHIKQSTYWLPSDADPEDESSWISIAEILNSVRSCKASHIALIIDSCFSGNLFNQASRGGGEGAFERLISREAITSGNIEEVKDGNPGEHSPFAKAILQVLSENESDSLLFKSFSIEVIKRIPSYLKQTPRTGSIANVEDAGGSLIFRKKHEINSEDFITNPNKTLEKHLNNLFIPLPQQLLVLIKEVIALKEEKNRRVKNQRFEEAFEIRVQEKKKYEVIRTEIENYVNSLHATRSIQRGASAIYNKTIQEFQNIDERMKREFEKAKSEKENESNFTSSLIPFSFGSFDATTSEIDLNNAISVAQTETVKNSLKNIREELANVSKKNILSFYHLLIDHIPYKENDYAMSIVEKTASIIIQILGYEANVVISGGVNRIDHEILIKEAEVEILKLLRIIPAKK